MKLPALPIRSKCDPRGHLITSEDILAVTVVACYWGLWGWVRGATKFSTKHKPVPRSKSLLALDINNAKFEIHRSILMCRYLSPVWLTESHILLEALLYRHSNPGHIWESQLNLTSPYTLLDLRRSLTHREDFLLPSTPSEVSSMVWSVASL